MCGKSKIFNFIFYLVSLGAASAAAASFEEFSKGLVIIQSSSGKEYLAAAVKLDKGTYAVTSQSLFLNPVPKFRLKTFSGEALENSDFDIDPKDDLVRIKIEDSPDLQPLEPAYSDAGNKNVYSLDSDTGIVYQSGAGGGSLVKKDFSCSYGAPVINDKGQFVGVASRTDDGLGNKEEIKPVSLGKDIKWQAEKPFLLAKEVYSLQQLVEFTKALDFVRDNNGKNEFIPIDSNTHPKLLSWLKDQNVQAFNNSVAKKTEKGSMGKAMREHQARCFQYSGMKRLVAFYSSNATMAKSGNWSSLYLKERAKSLYTENDKSADKMKAAMKSMVDKYPSVKAKF